MLWLHVTSPQPRLGANHLRSTLLRSLCPTAKSHGQCHKCFFLHFPTSVWSCELPVNRIPKPDGGTECPPQASHLHPQLFSNSDPPSPHPHCPQYSHTHACLSIFACAVILHLKCLSPVRFLPTPSPMTPQRCEPSPTIRSTAQVYALSQHLQSTLRVSLLPTTNRCTTSPLVPCTLLATE